MFIGTGISPFALRRSGESYTPEAATYFAALTGTVPLSVKALVNNLVVDLKANGDWTHIQHLPLLNMPNEQNAMVNLKSPSDTLMINVNSCTHTPYIGIQGNGTNSYINTKHNPSSYGGAYTLNSGLLGFGGLVEGTVGRTDIGGGSGGAAYAAIQSKQTGTLLYCDSNRGSSSTWNNNTSIGNFLAGRTGAAVQVAYRNATALTNNTGGTLASVSIVNSEIALLAYLQSGTPLFFSNNQLAYSIIAGGGLNPTTWNTAITTFVNAMAAL
jgi:hypothetical protein